MGSRLGLGLALSIAIGLAPVGEAFADRVQPQQQRQKAKTKRNAAPPREAAVSPAVALSLSGTYNLSSINGRPVRDVELAKAKVTFSPRGEVSVTVGCNGMGTTLQSRGAPNQILGFTQTVQTLIGCPPNQRQAEATMTRLLRETANIARAGNVLTFFNATGINIAQWATVASETPTPEASAPQRGVPAPQQARAYFGDYVLTELNGQPVIAGSTPTNPAPNSTARGSAARGSPANPARPVATSGAQPTFFLRENGQVAGSSGCNQYNSTLVGGPDTPIRFGLVVTSKKACLNPTIATMEQAFFAALRGANRIDLGGSQIDLFGSNGQRSARLSAIGTGAQASPSLYGRTWILRRFNGILISQTNRPTIVFNANRASGSTGCGNQFDIRHERQGSRSRFSNGIMTEMGCGDRSRNDLQIRYVTQLERITRIDITATSLTLRSRDNTTNMVFGIE